MNYDEMILQAKEKLFKALPDSFSDKDIALVHDACDLAEEAHKPQKRKSGAPYILHPLAVALIVLEEMRQHDSAIVAAALLHDVVEDTPYTIEDIRDRFGDDVAFLVGAVTKPNKEQVDNFQHILSSVHDDVRVLILKLSDRLNNMRTLGSMRMQKQWKIASETQFFFAPLAGRLGLFKVKSELENLAFQFLNPDEYNSIAQALEEDRERTRNAVEAFRDEAAKAVEPVFGGGVSWDIRYRKPYSIYREMRERGCDFYHVPFKHYIRALYDPELMRDPDWKTRDEKDMALKIYSVLASIYREQSGTLVNYITQPKANGYRSVHFRLLNPHGSIEEFHVSSRSMREQSYFGCVMESKEQWLKRLTAVLKELSEDPESMMLGIRDSLFNEDVVVFTTDARQLTLPKGATALDFAYELGQEIGDHAKYARINGRLCSIQTVLSRGDSVLIGTDPTMHPQPEWFNSVVTYKARKYIKSYLRSLPHSPYILCPHCHPLPESSELIGFDDGDHISLHIRNCPDAIRAASEHGHKIVAIDDFKALPNVLYPVKIHITAVDRYHLLRDIIDCIVEDHRLSMGNLSIRIDDNIFNCTIDFAVHSAVEFNNALASIRKIESVEEVRKID